MPPGPFITPCFTFQPNSKGSGPGPAQVRVICAVRCTGQMCCTTETSKPHDLDFGVRKEKENGVGKMDYFTNSKTLISNELE